MSLFDVIGNFVGSSERTTELLKALRKAGYVCVPIKETNGMVKAAWQMRLRRTQGVYGTA